MATGEEDVSSTSSQLHFVDLAGSERQTTSAVVGAQKAESKHINQSLSQLGLVIASLVRGENHHVPYR